MRNDEIASACEEVTVKLSEEIMKTLVGMLEGEFLDDLFLEKVAIPMRLDLEDSMDDQETRDSLLEVISGHALKRVTLALVSMGIISIGSDTIEDACLP